MVASSATYADYVSGAPSSASSWNITNDANLDSLKASLQEQAWNDMFGFNAMNPDITKPGTLLFDITASGGGASGV